MIYEKDWLTRQIERTLHAVVMLIYQEDVLEYVPSGDRETDRLQEELAALLTAGEVNGAEDRLFEAISPEKGQLVRLAVDFYHRLNAWSDEALSGAGFSREEIQSGLSDALKSFGFSPEIFQWDAAAPADHRDSISSSFLI